MKPMLLFWIVLVSLRTSSQTITFKGRINKDSKAEKVYLQGNNINIEIPITTGKEFFYKGTISQPGECLIKTDKSFAWTLWITGGNIDVTLQEWELGKPDPSGKKLLKITALSGPAETEKLQWFTEQRNKISSQFPHLTFVQYNDSMAKFFDPLLEEYIRNHPNSKFSVYITRLANSEENKAKLLSLVGTEVGKEERQRLETSMKRDSATRTGLTIEDFEMKTVQGRLFSSKNFSSHYALLEFWSHDCYPCRAQHPALLKIYNDFHEKGFEIVAVSLDESKIQWRKAIAKDKIPWVHVSDLKGWDNLLAKRYFVEAIPFNILIDIDKRIIATGLGTDALQKKLKELLNN